MSIIYSVKGILLMYEIIFYKDKNGVEPVYEYLQQLAAKSNKDSRIKLNKINDYIEILSQYGTRAGEPFVKILTVIFGSCVPCVTAFCLPRGLMVNSFCSINS